MLLLAAACDAQSESDVDATQDLTAAEAPSGGADLVSVIVLSTKDGEPTTRPAGPSALASEHRGQYALPGFDLQIARSGDDLTLTWANVGASFTVYRSSDPYFSPDDASAEVLATGVSGTSLTLSGEAVDGATHYYIIREAGGGTDSTTVGKFAQAMHEEYNIVGQPLLLDAEGSAADFIASFDPTRVYSSAYLHDAVSQQFRSSGGPGFTYGVGECPIARSRPASPWAPFDAITVGHVPAPGDVTVALYEGLNYFTTPLTMGDVAASDLLALLPQAESVALFAPDGDGELPAYPTEGPDFDIPAGTCVLLDVSAPPEDWCNADCSQTAACDDDCTVAECGDGVVNPLAGEDCDTSGAATEACDADCTVAECGDGVVNAAAGEMCDDGNAIDDDACTNACTLPPEDLCNPDCSETTECDGDCSVAECGDGYVNATAGEQCDTGGETQTCNADCTLAVCGDGIVNATAGEGCDDGNANDDDTCSNDCAFNPGGQPGSVMPVLADTVDIDGDGTTDNNYSYWEYVPDGYDPSGDPRPVIVWLGGIGEFGRDNNGNLPATPLPEGGCETLLPGPTAGGTGQWSAGNASFTGSLCAGLGWGPHNYLWRHDVHGRPLPWDEADFPFVVIAPQNPVEASFSGGPYEPAMLDDFLDYVVEAYNVDPRRMYLTGMSMGGYSVQLYLYAHPERFAAAATVPGMGIITEPHDPCDMGRVAFWAHHGENDNAGGGQFNATRMARWMDELRACPGPRPYPRFTMYPSFGHSTWLPSINPTYVRPTLSTFPVNGGTIDLDPNDITLYDWMLQYDLPEVSAGPDMEVSAAAGTITLSASVVDDDSVGFSWTQTGGSPLTLTNENTATLSVSDLQQGTYTFEVFAVDSDGQYDSDEVVVEIVDPQCIDGILDGDETDIDCGGSCDACPDGAACLSDGDCEGASCVGGICSAAECDDGFQNGDETDIDCGGSCGGCFGGESCLQDGDCDSLMCLEGGVCAETACDDGIQNGDETAVDCGGACGTCPGMDCTFYEDFEGIEDGGAWPEGWSVAGGVGIADVQGGWGRIQPSGSHTVGRMVAPFDCIEPDVTMTVMLSDDTSGVAVYVRNNGGYLDQTDPAGQGLGAFAEMFRSPDGIGIWRERDGNEARIGLTEAATFQPNVPYRLRLRTTQDATDATLLQAKLWRADQAEPAAWTVERYDTSPELQNVGGWMGVDMYVHGLSGDGTPATLLVDEISAGPAL